MIVPSAVALKVPKPDVEGPLAALESWTQTAGETLVVWTDRDGGAFKAGVGLGDVSGHGRGASRQEAKGEAARDLLKKLWDQSLDDAARFAAEQAGGRASS